MKIWLAFALGGYQATDCGIEARIAERLRHLAALDVQSRRRGPS